MDFSNIAVGVITGFSTGLVTFNYSQYIACKSRLLELVWRLETGKEWKDKEKSTRKQYYDFSSANDIYHIAGHLEALGHSNASKTVRELCQDITNLEVKSHKEDIGLEDFRIEHEKFMDKAASINFSFLSLLSLGIYKKGHYPPYNWLHKK